MGHGCPSAFEFQRAGCHVGLGLDCPAICGRDMFYCMRLAINSQRGRYNSEYYARNKLPSQVRAKVDEVLYMGTLGGAEAIHGHSSDVSTVLVNGEIVKSDGKLVRVDWMN